MTKTREFPTAVLASITSGKLLCKFGDLHEAAEFIMGHPIWTHHFANKEFSADMKRTLLAQCPSLPLSIDGVTPENYQAKVAELEGRIGKSFIVSKGSGLTAMLPTDGIPDHLQTRTIIV